MYKDDSAHAAPHESPASTRIAALVAATLSSFMTPFMGSSIAVALPAIGHDLGMDAVALSWVATSFILSAAVFLVPFGRLSDILGRRKVFAWGIATFTISSFLCGIAVSSFQLILLRAVQGIGSAMIFATGMAIVTSVFPPEERGRALGINVGAVYTGLSLGPFIGGILTQHLTWRSVFLVTVPFGILTFLIVRSRLRVEWADAKGEPFDFEGALIYGASLTALVLGMSHLPDSTGLWIMLCGTLGLFVFILWEQRVPHPVFPIALFTKNRLFAFSCLAALIHYSATFGATFLLSLYLQYVKGLSPQTAGLVLVAQPAVMAASSPFAGRLSDTIEPRLIASVGMALTAAALFALLFVTPATPLWKIGAALLLLGTGYGLFSSPNSNAIMGSVDRSYYGLASGAVGTMRLLGMMISMGITTVILMLFVGRVQVTPETHAIFMTSVRYAFAVFSGLCMAGVFSSMVRGRMR